LIPVNKVLNGLSKVLNGLFTEVKETEVKEANPLSTFFVGGACSPEGKRPGSGRE
jgi:hypothetical protein